MEFSRIVELKFQKSQYIWYNYIFGNFQEFQVLELSSTILIIGITEVVISSAGKLWIGEGFCYLEKGSWFERPFLSLNETTSLGLRLETRFVSSWHFNSQKIRQPSNDHDHHFVVNISISKLVCGNFVTWPMEAADQSTAWWLNICPTASTHSQFTIRDYFDFWIIKFWSKVTHLVIYHNQCQRVILMDRKQIDHAFRSNITDLYDWH